MKIGIDARLWGTRHAGIGRYTEELVRNLQQIDRENNYILFCRKKDFNQIKLAKRWKKVIADVPHYTLQEQLALPFIFDREKLDILHVPHFNVPVLYNSPFVVTIHDVLWHDVRGRDVTTQPPLVYSIKHLGYRLVVRNAIYRSEKILVPSKAVKDDLIERFRVSENKVMVTYDGVSSYDISVYRYIGISKKYRLNKPYLLYVGNLYPHKNVEMLLRAFKTQNSKLKTQNLTLVVVCGRSVFWERFKRFVEQEGAQSWVRLVGHVTDEELAVLYKNAEAFVFPTLSEGFGLPGLEAMAYGTPVVCSDIPVLREIYGDAALYFNPKNANDIANKIRRIIADGELRTELVEKGKKQTKKYSWSKMAEQTLKVYNDVVRSKNVRRKFYLKWLK